MAILANHLLQSTIFAALAGMLTLFLRDNHARTRYWIWLAASVKFLVPFAVFVEIGHGLSWSTAPAIAQTRLAAVMNRIGQPLAVPEFYSSTSIAAAPASNVIPALVCAIWICGCAAVLIFWFARWHRVAAVLRTALPLTDGRELDSLRRLEPISGVRRRTTLVSSSSQLEPGIFGFLRPVLYLPEGLADHLDDAQLDAVFTHELCHIRRRDNLTAGFHMLVEAVFWFHPLVWWIGVKLVEERERACDEEVVQSGSDPEIYAASILKICRFYLASPLPCAAGISGSGLGRRIENIILNPVRSGLSDGRKLLLGALGLLAFVMPIVFGILTVPAIRAARLQFESASVAPAILGLLGRSGGPGTDHPEEIAYKSITLGGLMRYAFGVNEDQISGPASLYLDNYAITAKIPPGTNDEQLRVMWQNLLTDRFHMILHYATRETPGYELVVASGGPKLKDSALASNASGRSSVPPEDSRFTVDKDGFPQLGNRKGMAAITAPDGRSMETYQSCSVSFLVRLAARQLGTWIPAGGDDRTFVPALVVDKTGLTGEYDFTLAFRGKEGGNADFSGVLENQLGLKLQKVDRIPVDVLVVDHVDRFLAH